jgi:anaerobic selenocysteine-containing dehydrogenase
MANQAAESTVRDSTCRMCDNGCPTRVYVEDGRISKIEMANAEIANLCPRWKAQIEYIYHPDRLLYPLKRTGKRGEGKYSRISWDEALDTVASSLLDIKAKWGPEAVVFFIAFPKEPRPYYKRLAYAFGSPNYCTESSNCATSVMLATGITYGRGLMMMDPGVDPKCRCKVIWSSSIRNSWPTAWKPYMDIKSTGMKLIVVDPRRTRLAEMADIHLQLRPGTDGALALGMLNVIIQGNLYDADFVADWTVGFDELSELAKEYTPGKVAQITGVPANLIIEAATKYATSKPAQIRTSICATTHSSNGFQNHRAILMLPAVTGNIDIPRYSPGMPSGQSAGSISLDERIAKMPPGLGSDRFPLWTSYNGEMQSNVIADRIETASPYPIKALFAAGFNVKYFPNTRRFIDNARKLDFIVVTEYFHNEGTSLADIVLPIASWLERPVLNAFPGRAVRLATPIIEPPGETRPEWDIYAELAVRMGFGNEFWDGNFEKCLEDILEPMGITAAELKQHPEGIKPEQVARPEKEDEKVGFQTPSGKIELKSSIMAQYGYEPLPVYREPVESPLSQPEIARSYPLVLTSGARTIVYTHSQFRQIASLRRMIPEPLVDINPVDANERGIESGDEVEVSSRRGNIRLNAHVTDNIKAGVVNLPHGWAEANVNALIDDTALDPVSGFAPFKAQLCQVKLVRKKNGKNTPENK